MKRLEQYIGILLLIIAIGFNLWVFRTETMALIDPNDNTFQFALVERTNQIYDFANNSCSGITKPFCVLSLLSDHWVPNWAQGYNLPYYYSHVPQIAIVASYRVLAAFMPSLSLFAYYHIVIYLLLSLFPVALFFALRIIGMSWLTAGVGGLIASQLSTDGLYGLDPASFLWRGYGLSSQLFAMVWLPLALAFAYRAFRDNTARASLRNLVPAILMLTATTAGHLGLGIMAFLSIGVIAIGPYAQATLAHDWTKETTDRMISTGHTLFLLFGGVGLLLGYWILPILFDGNYHNISVWDGIWKFDSFGYRRVLTHLFNGDLFDFGRLPVLTTLVAIGIFASLQTQLFPFALLFVFWLLMYFGRTTWGNLIDLIPGMNEFHLSRFIVGVHLAGLFLIPIGFTRLVSKIKITIEQHNHSAISGQLLYYSITLLLLTGMVIAVFPQTIRYASHNDFLIKRANTDYSRDADDVQQLITRLSSLITQKPGRVFAGRGGSWGKGFRIAETPMYMHLSTYGIPVILWLPETWSPNSDTEQYFSENNPAHYTLYNVRYVVTPHNLPKEQIQPFWTLLETGKTWRIYGVVSTAAEANTPLTEGYITAGIRTAIVSASKTDYRTVVRLWMHAPYSAEGLYPELTFDPNYPKKTGLPNFRMLDEVTYKVPDGSMHNLFAEPPLYLPPGVESLQAFGALEKPQYAGLSVVSQSGQGDMIFTATVTVTESCRECIVLLKQSFHPSWRATINGKTTPTFAVFPFYTAVKLNSPGNHEVVFTYEPAVTKKALLMLSLVFLGSIFAVAWKQRKTE